MDPGTDGVPGLSLSSRCERAHVIAVLGGDLGIACAPALREQLLGLLRPDASRLVTGLSRVSHADASGLAVPAAGVARVLRITGLRLRPRPPAVFAASSTRSPARPHLRQTRAHHRVERLVPIGQRHVTLICLADHSERPLAIAPGFRQ